MIIDDWRNYQIWIGFEFEFYIKEILKRMSFTSGSRDMNFPNLLKNKLPNGSLPVKPEESAMNKPAKLESSKNTSSSSSSMLGKKQKKQQQQIPRRNPLNDLNSISAEAGRRGCFGFLKDPKPRTPKSAPRTLPTSKNPTNPSNSHRKPSKPTSESPKLPRVKNPPLNRRKASSKDPILGPVLSSKGKEPYPYLNPDKSGGLSSEMASPEKTPSGSRPRMGLETSNTPNSNSTPPVQASISPEIACGSNVDPTPVCFAAGYVVAGVHDRRKCRPRGILTVGGDGGNIFTSRSRTASPPPIAGASIQWVSSPSRNFSGCRSPSTCCDEASVNWLLSPHHDGNSDEVGRESSDNSFWRFSLTNSDTSRSPVLKGLLGAKSSDLEMTPSSGNATRATPTSSSSISPFSAIVRRANASSSGFRIISPCPHGQGYHYESASDLSYSKSRRISDLDSAAEVLGSMRLSPQNDGSDLPMPLLASSFQFSCPSTPSSSVDLTGFKKQVKVSPLKSEFRVSWREGLISRIYEMGEFDCCKWLSDDEDNVNCHGEDEEEYVFGRSFELNNNCLAMNEGNHQDLAKGSASFEFPREGKGVEMREAKAPPAGPVSCAESISLESAGLISSSDSDWTFSYNNGLFDSKR